jgi:hypothetical protein
MILPMTAHRYVSACLPFARAEGDQRENVFPFRNINGFSIFSSSYFSCPAIEQASLDYTNLSINRVTKTTKVLITNTKAVLRGVMEIKM